MSSTQETPSAPPQGHAHGLRQTRVRLASGVSLCCVERGPRGAPPVVLLHGLADSWRSFEALIQLLPASLHLVVPTLRGHGESDRPERGYELADFARDLQELLEALALESAVIVGHSLGANVALRFALEYPEHARGLAMLSAFARHRGNPAVDELSAAIGALSDPVDGMFIRDFQRATLARPIAPELVERMIQESRQVPVRVWQSVVAALLRQDAAPAFASLRVPTLLLWGTHDAFVPRADQERFLAAIPGCGWREYPGGHSFHWEDPASVAEDLAAFALACSGIAALAGPGLS